MSSSPTNRRIDYETDRLRYADFRLLWHADRLGNGHLRRLASSARARESAADAGSGSRSARAPRVVAAGLHARQALPETASYRVQATGRRMAGAFHARGVRRLRQVRT